MGNILLIGMPGAGKSTVGVILAKTVGFDFVDTDILLSRQIGYTLQDFIDKFGIEEFLRAEERAALSISCNRTVIATGGSMVLSDKAMRHLKEGAKTFWLNPPFEELERRLGNIKSRGIVMAGGQDIRDIYEQRLSLYEKYADIVISPSGPEAPDIESVVAEIIRRLKRPDSPEAE